MTLTHIIGRTPLDEGSADGRDLYLTNTHNTHKTQTSIHLAGYESQIPAKERPQKVTHVNLPFFFSNLKLLSQTNFDIPGIYRGILTDTSAISSTQSLKGTSGPVINGEDV